MVMFSARAGAIQKVSRKTRISAMIFSIVEIIPFFKIKKRLPELRQGGPLLRLQQFLNDILLPADMTVPYIADAR
jgi:hypothetical protein